MAEAPVLVFINPASGSGLGEEFITACRSIEGVHFVHLPDDVSTFATTYQDLLHDERLRIISAGGDGTANWVVSLLAQIYPLDSKDWKPPIAICPFGTGNDLSRTLKWGTGFSHSDIRHIPDLIAKVRSANVTETMDIWTTTITRLDTGEVIKKQLLNYFSFGVDAAMANAFESCRQSCRWMFCCHCMSKTLYVPMGFVTLCGQPNLKNVLDAKMYDVSDGVETERTIEFKSGEKTLCISNITYIYGGRDLWRSRSPRSISDGKLEVVAQGNSAKLGMTHIGIYLGREVCQTTKFVATTSEPIAYQIDGEGAVANGPARFEIVKVGQFPFLFNE